MLPLIALAGALHAEDLTTTEGRIYKGVAVTKVEPDGISIVHESGTAKVPFGKLSKELQEKHGYDPKKAAEFADRQARKLSAAEAEIERGLEGQRAAVKKREDFFDGAQPREQFKVAPTLKDGISLAFAGRFQLLAEKTLQGQQAMLSKEELAREIGNVPAGRLVVTWTRENIKHADPERFSVIITGEDGKVLQRARGEWHPSEPLETGGWVNGMAVTLNKGVKGRIGVRVIDEFAGSHVDFVVKRSR